ncbi:hypothetical protein BDN70DRAFT_898422 [Pholiota conissans]|uniref:Fungal-type protein kinase domain-containing protein n=1 Tax=Pholiota conissans TaxID=109636 RepID=A0A9P5YV35_9AGAR|nr:hypothetical protein BDN70DRAFT_898422 [Pholiota conissans]
MKKSAMYEPFIEAVAAYTPGMKFFDTHKHPDNDAYGYAPDISAYDEDDLPDPTRRTDFSKMSLFLEFKLDLNEDPFEDLPKKIDKENFSFEKETDESKKGLSYDKFLKVMVPDREKSKVENPVLVPLPLKKSQSNSGPYHRAPGKDKEPMLPELVQYRITLLDIGLRVDDYTCPKDAIEGAAHDDSYFKAKVLHRDISAGNILITKNGLGSQSLKGTWQFMSARLLERPQAHQGIEDDRESAFWVILWIAVKHRNNYGVDDDYDSEEVLSVFDSNSYASKNKLEGYTEMGFFLHSIAVVFTGVPQLSSLLEELRRKFLSYYINLPASAADAPAHTSSDNPLRAQGWLVDIMQKYLDKGPWFANDVPVTSNVVLITDNKRAAEAQNSTKQKRARKDT